MWHFIHLTVWFFSHTAIANLRKSNKDMGNLLSNCQQLKYWGFHKAQGIDWTDLPAKVGPISGVIGINRAPMVTAG